ncbi:MAG: bifunctional folylpolyglutamate synthase/dihydrofolate synthase [Nitrospirae bacterium]|nr:bifunctional folylpolyglutamate synthase/dihydrofolate synthase [Nitrospirota bacterium]
MRYERTIEFLYRLQWHGMRFDLEPTEMFLAAAGRPHRAYHVLHVGGTNGKGSTAAMLASMLREAGYSVGLYTSPHLIDFTERIRINGRPVGQDEVVALTEELRAALPSDAEPTFFEFTTVLAFLAFARARVDVAVVEVGMGGRLDATNLVHPLVSVITNVEADHQRYLGETIAEIAREKAGIIKPGVPLVTAATRSDALAVLVERADRLGSRLTVVGKDVRAEGTSPSSFAYHGSALSVPNLSCPLRGRHQLTNAATALAAIDVARGRGLAVDAHAVRRGLARVQWEGRLEVVKARPSIFVDGAHNPAGAEVLADFVREERARRPGARLVIVFGILADKDLKGIIEPVGTLADEVVLTEPSYHRAASVEALRAAASSLSVPVRVVPTLSQALDETEARLADNDWCVVTGSLYTVGEVKAVYQGTRQLSILRG